MSEIEPFLNQEVNTLIVAHAIGLFVLARVGWVALRRACLFGFYVVASGLLRYRWVVRGCAVALIRWQVDLERAILDLQSDHLAAKAGVLRAQGTADASTYLKVESSARQFAPRWGAELRVTADCQGRQLERWAKRATRRDRRAHYGDLLAQEIRRVLRIPTDT